MVGRVSASALIALGLASCSTVPHYNEDPRIRPADVVARVQCELKFAAEDPTLKNLGVDDYAAGFTLSLKVETDVNPNVKGDWVIPYHLTDTFTASPTAGLDDNVVRDSGIKFTLPIAALHDYQCPSYLEQAYREDVKAAQISYGSFGLVDWFGRVSGAVQTTNLAAPGDMNYTVKFAVTGTANPAPGFKIINLTTVVNLPVKRIDTNTLDFALKKISTGATAAKAARSLHNQLAECCTLQKAEGGSAIRRRKNCPTPPTGN